MVNKTFEIPLDIKQPTSSYPFEVVEGDSGNILKVKLTDDGAAVDLTDCRVMAVFSRPDGATVEQDTDDHGVTVGGDAHNEITIDLYTSSFRPGNVACEIQVYSGTNNSTLVTSAQFNFSCRRSILNDDTIQAEEKYPILVGLISDTETAIDNAEEATEAANAAAEAATEAMSGIWTGTLAEYNALTSYAPGGVYFVKEE